MPASALKRLLDHYDRRLLPLPWRSLPGGRAAPDPYRVWLSEVMLQQTTVATVTPRFRRFVDRWPTVEALAARRDEEVLSEWAGLGYYARARNLIACAREVAARGGFPATEAELRKLPGLGAYTAAAIAAIAFGERAVVIDTNVERGSPGYSGSTALAEAASEIRMPPRHDPRGAAGRLRSGDDGSWRDHLPAKESRLPRLPAGGRMPGICERQAGAFPAPKRKRTARIATASPGGSSATARVAGTPPGQGHARRDGGACPDPSGATAPPPDRALATVTHGFTHFTLDLHVVARLIRSATAGGSRSTA